MDVKKISFGEYSFTIYGRPASLQSSSNIKEQYKLKIKNEIKDCPNIFVREIGVRIEWYTDFSERYEKDSSYDIDNIVKPTLDAMTGREGLFIDDCQVQNVECFWVDKDPGSEDSLHIRVFSLEKNDDYVLEKDKVCFFQKDGPVYYLVPIISKDGTRIFYKSCKDVFLSAEKLRSCFEDKNIGDEKAKKFEMCLLPMMAIKYHKTRINKSGFSYVEKEKIDEFIESLDAGDDEQKTVDVIKDKDAV